MFAHHPVKGGEGCTRIGPNLGGQQRCGALHPCHVGVAFGPGAGEHSAGSGDGFDQLTLFTFEGQLGTLRIDDFMQAFGLGQRGRDAGGGGRGGRSTTFVRAGRIKIVLDPCQPLGHQLRDAALGQADPRGESSLAFRGVEFSHFRPQTLEGSCAALPHIQIGPKGTAQLLTVPSRMFALTNVACNYSSRGLRCGI